MDYKCFDYRKIGNKLIIKIYDMNDEKKFKNEIVNLFVSIYCESFINCDKNFIDRIINCSFGCFLEDDQKETDLIIFKDVLEFWLQLEKYVIVETENSIYNVSIVIQETLMDFYYRTVTILSKEGTPYKDYVLGNNYGIKVSHKIDAFESEYNILNQYPIVEESYIKPPFITYSASNIRKGIFSSLNENPVNMLTSKDEFYCLPIYIGDVLTYVYLSIEYMCHMAGLCNLFQFVDIRNNRETPKLIVLFGVNTDKEPYYYEDVENGMIVGMVPSKKECDYFGYMKKMLLTIYNVKMIKSRNLPCHGAGFSIITKNGTTKNIVIIGDSGAGKSETLEQLKQIACDDIRQIITIFDDMGTLKFDSKNNEIKAYGTEIGAFVRTDDLPMDFIYREFNQAVFMNPSNKNSRLIITVSTHNQILKGYKIDMFLYANNYEDTNLQLQKFSTLSEAKHVFIRGARFAKGTTSEKGLVESFFANPFGPIQNEKETRKLIDLYFEELTRENVFIGQLFTKLGINGMETRGPKEAANKLYEYIFEEEELKTLLLK